jgi:TonB family protein
MSSIAHPLPDMLAPDLDERRRRADRQSLWRSTAASIGLHLLVFCLLFLMSSAEAPIQEKPLPTIKLVMETGHGAAGAAGGGSGDIAAQGDPAVSAAASSASQASAETAPPPSTAETARDTTSAPTTPLPAQPPAPAIETTQPPPAMPTTAEELPAPSPAGILPPISTPERTIAPTPPPAPRHKPVPPKPKIVHVTPPAEPVTPPTPPVAQTPPVPAPPLPAPQPNPATAKDYSHLPPEVAHPNNSDSTQAVATADASTGGAPNANGGGGRGRGLVGKGRAAFGDGDLNDPYDDYLERLQRYIRPQLKALEAQTPQKEEGRVVVGFVLARDGTISDVEVEESSGKFALDHMAVQGVRDSSPAPPPPAKDMGDHERLKLSVPINFTVGFFDGMFH